MKSSPAGEHHSKGRGMLFSSMSSVDTLYVSIPDGRWAMGDPTGCCVGRTVDREKRTVSARKSRSRAREEKKKEQREQTSSLT